MRGKGALSIVVLVTLLAGCAMPGTGGRDDDAAPAAWPRCEDPWPCGDGREWPRELVPAPHPREPAVLPDALAPRDAEVVDRTPTSATFRWRVPTVDAAPLSLGDAARLAPTVRFDIPAPDGLYLAWSADLELPSDPDGRSYDLSLLDDAGEMVCFTDHDFSARGMVVQPGGDSNVGCSAAPRAPLAAPTTYAVELRHEVDRAGDEIGILVTVAVAEPFLAFDRLPVERVRVPMRDGVELDGALWRPVLPDGVRAPTVLVTMPYIAQCSAQSRFQGCGPVVTSEGYLANYGLATLLSDGYAVAIVSVRGTGGSGGCYDAWGPIEQEDHAELVRWLASQPWSNGRVGMTGLSYMGTTPWEAAISGADALKAFVVGGIISDVYLGGFTPQGAANDGSVSFHARTTMGNSLLPPRGGDTLPDYLAVAGDRACPEVQRQLLVHQEGAFTDARDARWFEERRLIDRFGDVRAAALVLHGVEDDNYHRYQEDAIWDALPHAPKGMVLGQWDHTDELDGFLAGYDGPGSWYAMSRAWFDFWLKGLGEPPRELGLVSYQDTAGAWRATDAWPPPEARHEALFLSDGKLVPAPGSAGVSFRAARSPTAEGPRAGNPSPCGGDPASSRPQDARWATFVSEPLAADVLVAGNPWAYLQLSSDQPGGVVALDLYALAPDGTCVEPLSDGAADLRFHAGNMAGRDFPVGETSPVRVDLYSAATFVPKDHRLVVVLSGGGHDYKQGQVQYEPQITVDGASHVVLPLVEGTLRGGQPLPAYPPRPFTAGGGA